MITFSTSGYRGIIGDTFTKEILQKIGFSFRRLIETEKKKIKIIVGYDNRFMGREFARWFCEAVACDSIKITLMCSAVPSPYITFKTANGYDFGIMLTSSHNPFYYQGIKFFMDGGRDADDGFYQKITEIFDKLKNVPSVKFDTLVASGHVVFSDDTEDYINKVISGLDVAKIKESKLKVLYNPMHGSSIEITKALFKKLGVTLHAINDNVDPYFGNDLPAAYPRQLTPMIKMVQDGGYNFGFALDGDGDRISFVCPEGRVYDCNFLMAVFYYYFAAVKKQRGGIVKPFPTSNLASKLCKHYGGGVYETRVGSKFVSVKLRESDAIVGAEGNGILLKDISYARDGSAAAATLCDMIAATKKSITQILDEITRLVNFPSSYLEFAYVFDVDNKVAILSKLLSKDKPNFKQKIIRTDVYPDGFKTVFAGDYWFAARTSGTENLVRFYVEMPTEQDGLEVLKKLEEFYGLSERQK